MVILPSVQVYAPKNAKHVHIPRWGINKHISLVFATSLTGTVVRPLLIVEGKKLDPAWVGSWEEALWAMDSAGYNNETINHRYMESFIFETAPAGGATSTPRLLCFDNYYSHLTPDTLEMLRRANIRAISMSPHTTQYFCIPDTSIFREVKRSIKRSFDDFETLIHMNNIGGVIKEAVQAATVIEVNAVTGERSCAASRGAAAAGLVPFTRALLAKPGLWAPAAAFKASAAAAKLAAGVVSPEPAKSVRPTAEQLAALTEDFKQQQLRVVLPDTPSFKPSKVPKDKMLSEVVSGRAYIDATKAKAEMARLEEARLEVVRAVRAKRKADAPALLEAKKARKALREAKKKAKADAIAATAAAKAAKQAVGVKRRAAPASGALEGPLKKRRA